MNRYVFSPGGPVWADIATLIEGVITKWICNHEFRGQTVQPLEFHGNICCCLVAENSSHLSGVAHGYQAMKQCSFKELPGPSKTKTQNSLAHDNEYFHRLQQVTFGHAFEKMRPTIKKKWGWGAAARQDWPRLVDFAYHVRNGAFHGNQFSFESTVHPNTKWRDVEIVKDLNGTEVMGMSKGFLGVADVIALLHDLEEKIYQPST